MAKQEQQFHPAAEVEYGEDWQPKVPGPRIKTSFADTTTCERCKGSGRVPKVFTGSSIDGGGVVGAPGDAPCPLCKGTGLKQ